MTREGASPAFERVQTALMREKGVRSIRLNAASGSVLVVYEPGIADPNAIIDIVAHTADLGPPITEEELRARQPRVVEVIAGAVRDLDTLTQELTGGRADLRDLVPLAMTGAAALSFVAKKDRLPHWANLAFWAFSIFQDHRRSERPPVDEPEPPERRYVRRGRPS
jgi:hypothetical protein